jgi:GT2 family glycosyltransferase
VSIIIPTWNGRALLERNLPSVRAALAAHPAGGEVIVVDDGGDDDSAAWIKATQTWARCVERAANGGFAAAINDGVAAARHDLVLLLNNDMRVEPAFLAALTAPFSGAAPPFAVVPRIINRTYGGDEAISACRFRFGLLETIFPERKGRSGDAGATVAPIAAWATGEVLFACGGAAAIDRRRWLELGGLDPLFAPFYWEDVDLSWRARKRGWTILHVPSSVVHHEHAATIGARFDAADVRVIFERNRLLFQWKNLTSARLTASLLAWLPLRLARALYGRPDFLRGFLGAVRRLPAALAGRRRERAAQRLRDEAILERFRA